MSSSQQDESSDEVELIEVQSETYEEVIEREIQK
jgi:hypothetical protein